MGEITTSDFQNNSAYIEIGSMPAHITKALGFEEIRLVIKHEYNESIKNSALYAELQKRENEYPYLGTEYFSYFIEHPDQIRNAGNESLLIIRSYPTIYFVQGKPFGNEHYALRIVPLNKNYWEIIDFDINYKLNRQHKILWP